MSIKSNQNKTSKKSTVGKKNESRNAVFGVYLAEIVSTKDISRTGRVRVFIPAISKDKNSTAGYFDAVWTSPFAGSTDPRTVGTKIEDPSESMISYGLWAGVPDNGNLVLIAFGDGNTKYPMVMSCLFADKLNYSLPGNAGGKTYQAPSLNLPTVEKNKRTADINHNDTFRPIQHTLSESIVKQGLAHDPIRGAGSSSARRESPSEVFGLLTPGPRDPNKFNNRLGGHSITLDDSLGSRQIRIRSAQGNQLLLDDTTGMVYLINRDGNVWMEFASSGEVFMYAESDINMRTKRNFNLRADNNVNIEAGQNVNIKAAQDHDGAEYVGEGQGAGGQVNIESKTDTHILSNSNLFTTTMEGEMHFSSAGAIHNTADALHNKITADIANEAGGKITSKSGGVQVLEAGGNIVEKAPKVLMNSGGPGADTADAAEPATPIGTDTFVDNPPAAPGYDRDAESPVTTNGKRVSDGPAASVVTIVSTLVTSEPFVGHGIPDPSKDDQANMVPDESISKGLPQNSNGVGGGAPADVNTPAGLKKGVLGDDGSPKYTSPAQVQNNFAQAKAKKFEAAQAGKIASMLGSSIPAIRSPKITPMGSRIAGLGTNISDLANKQKMLAFDSKGLPADLQSANVKAMQNKIKIAQGGAKNPAELQSLLQKQGVSTLTDGTSTIYSAPGLRVVDMKSGLGPVGTQMLTTSSLIGTGQQVKGMINSNISDNQLGALTSMANHIGTDNFSKSKVLSAVNNNEHEKVPNLMMAHSSQKVAGVSQIQGDHYQRRQMEGELYQTPDGVEIKTYTSRVSFDKQALDLKNSRGG
jgi:GH24 family phage-related lysozyme (muramidase)